ncbi:MAG: hypothetical protein V2A65_00420 [Candidatus Omnitrophota bacterium]
MNKIKGSLLLLTLLLLSNSSILHSQEVAALPEELTGEVLYEQGMALFKQEKYQQTIYEKEVTVEMKVVDSYNSGKACFFNSHSNWKKYFTAVIFRSDFHKFSSEPENYYYNKKIRVSGVLKEYKGKPEIIVKTPDQIEIIK